MMLSPPEVDIHTSLFSSGGYAYPPIYQCKKCFKVFKTGWNENSLVEILVNELSEEDKKKIFETKKRKVPLSLIWLIIFILGVLMIGIIFLVMW